MNVSFASVGRTVSKQVVMAIDADKIKTSKKIGESRVFKEYFVFLAL